MHRMISVAALALFVVISMAVPSTSYSSYSVDWTGESWALPSDAGAGNGLAYENDGSQEYIWQASWYTGQISRLRLSDGVTDRSFTSPSCGEFPTCESSGLEFVDGYLWHVTGFGKAYKLDPVTGAKLGECTISSSPRGLAWGAGHFWTVDFDNNTWYWFDCPGGMGPTYATPLGHSNAISWDGAYLWVGSVEYNYIYKYDPSSGAKMDSARLWLSGGIRSIQIVPSATSPWIIYAVPHDDPATLYKGVLGYDGPTATQPTTWGCVKSLYR